ncbi:MAG: 4Fe-4S dicluster domain-containing protein [Deltaproteobacteria bacterium]|jgi:NADH-quinone oxidoreductase subunit F|nr:4Fe-4S dicluster domain-containing protein [Deltaproteobacteria bacterium]
MRLKSIEELRALRRELAESPAPERRLWVCGGPGCLASGALEVFRAVEAACLAEGMADGVRFRADLSGCLGLCERGPLVEVEPEGWLYGGVKPEDAPELVRETLSGGRFLDRLAADPECREKDSIPFYLPQRRHVMARFGRTRPESLTDYLAAGGYGALELALSELGPEEAFRRVELSGLRGRGGGGFPAGRKWRALKEAAGRPRYLIANGDEGDPGAFMNRALMEGDPLSVIEGMTVGAYALGAEEGFVYVRHEYPLSVERLSSCVRAAEETGLLGDDILGRGFGFRLRIVEGGGAFVCGESTALTASIEGREGQPRVKYVRTTEAGLWEKPTLLQNVESWANVPMIVRNGPDWFRETGTGDNPGTKVFSLVGKVRRTGLVELPLGSSVGSLVNGAGGGVPKGRRFKAVQSGGPSGGCLPESALDLPLDFDALAGAGAMMGSGGLIVMDDLSCLVDTARYFTAFLSGESCGKCAPCREGLPVILEVLTDMTEGRARVGDTDFLEHQARMLAATALCGLGKSAANPVLSTLRHFRREYLEHEAGFCRAGRCRGMYLPEVDPGACRSCGMCQKACPADAIEGVRREPRRVAAGKCITCGACLAACSFEAVKAHRRPEGGPDARTA